MSKPRRDGKVGFAPRNDDSHPTAATHRADRRKTACFGSCIIISMVMRKYETESRVSIVVLPAIHGRQKDMREVQSSEIEDCHLYIVSRRPRLSIPPSSVQIESGRVFFEIRAQVGDTFTSYPTDIVGNNFKGEFSWETEWPYEDFRLRHDGEVVLDCPVGILPHKMEVTADALLEQEVLYIGQAFGKDGERNAFDRLKSHSTLQAIYADNRPDFEIWLTLCKISDVALVQDMDTGEAQVSGEEDTAHVLEVFQRVNSPQFYSREALAMAEAGLIRFFRPQYNEKFRNNFPDPKHVHISTAYELDLADLMVELFGHALNIRFWTKQQPARSTMDHTARFPLRASGGLASLIIPAITQEAPDAAK